MTFPDYLALGILALALAWMAVTTLRRRKR